MFNENTLKRIVSHRNNETQIVVGILGRFSLSHKVDTTISQLILLPLFI